ncbi:hypothetical protein MSG28_006698 [Choristoneura fumiferana]|uniref:Uncharacterized protein n=1 Tax=Choristoneura fumiferana TaxID=7141 RepID=A0ACC0JLM2_CHOFU|nr:hypothetical protein MSG28_006698 [Choristoneura fumiferana]
MRRVVSKTSGSGRSREGRLRFYADATRVGSDASAITPHSSGTPWIVHAQFRLFIHNPCAAGVKLVILKVDTLFRHVHFHVSLLRVSKEGLRTPVETLDFGSMVKAVRVSALSVDVDSEGVELYGVTLETSIQHENIRVAINPDLGQDAPGNPSDGAHGQGVPNPEIPRAKHVDQ